MILPHYPQPARWPLWRRVLTGAICSVIVAAAFALTAACYLTPSP